MLGPRIRESNAESKALGAAVCLRLEEAHDQHAAIRLDGPSRDKIVDAWAVTGAPPG
jgi:hypothetical protein